MNRFLRGIKWLWGTSWPLFATAVLGANITGAIAVMLFVRFFIPMPEIEDFTQATPNLLSISIAYLVFAILVGMTATYLLFRPVLDWQRHPEQHDRNMVRYLVMRIPVYQAGVAAFVWIIGILVATILAGNYAARLGLVVAVATSLTGMITILITYLQAERLVRPVAAEALARRFEDSTLEPPIKVRLLTTWVMTTGVPILGIVLLLFAHQADYFTDNAADLIPPVLLMAATGIVTGLTGTMFAMMSVIDPIKELQDAINRVRRGESNVAVDIYDGSEMGVLQAGFNEMMKGLRERERVRDIFGRYVGTEVATKALEERPELGGEDREVAVLFVDVIGSTTFAVSHTPEEVVDELNQFFERVVECVHRNRGIINKFQGDAALAVFGAPLQLTDANSLALQAARELREELKGLELHAGIGVAAGHVVAGHIGGSDRFEYTVIGDAVNQAARLTELAKDTPGQILTNAATLRGANEVEQARWTFLKSIELRGRGEMTQLARPVRATLADRS